MDKKTRPIFKLSARDLPEKGTHRLRVKEWRNICHANGSKKSCSSNTCIRQNRQVSDKEGHYIVIKASIQQEDITLVNI